MSNQITTTQSNPIAPLKKVLESKSVNDRLNEVLQDKKNGFVSSLLEIYRNNKLLQKANPVSVLQAAMVAATVDLPISPSLGFAYVVPYKDVAQFQIGYKGLIQLALRSGQIDRINVIAVPKGALKSYDPLTEEIAVDNSVESDETEGYCAYFRLTNGFEKRTYWTVEKVRKHANRFSQSFRSGRSSPWQTDFDAMAKKTVLKSIISTYAPMSIEMQTAVSKDQVVIDKDGGESFADNESVIDIPSEPDLGDNPELEATGPSIDDVLEAAEKGGGK